MALRSSRRVEGRRWPCMQPTPLLAPTATTPFSLCRYGLQRAPTCNVVHTPHLRTMISREQQLGNFLAFSLFSLPNQISRLCFPYPIERKRKPIPPEAVPVAGRTWLDNKARQNSSNCTLRSFYSYLSCRSSMSQRNTAQQREHPKLAPPRTGWLSRRALKKRERM